MRNSELRRRKPKDQNGHTVGNRKRKVAKSYSIQTSLICLIISATILTSFLIIYVDMIPWHVGHHAIDQIAQKLGYQNLVHAVVIDAGSTGSRVLAFTFHESYVGGHLVLDKELFKHTQPGMSHYADEPAKAVESIAKLIELAKEEIPEQYWHKTPLILKATAGLRLLPTEKAENLLNSVREYFKTLPFLTQDDSVEIMDGSDEGKLSWFTINFLLDRISSHPSKTVAALDLGGGSTQVTFSALTPASLAIAERLAEVASPNGNIPLYSHSYLGLGLMAARKEILTFNQGNKTKVTSECLNHIVKDHKWHYGNTDYYLSGPQDKYLTSKSLPPSDFWVDEDIPIVDFAKCEKLVTSYVSKKATPPEELPNKHIYAFSYYFDRATESGLIDPATGGQVELKSFKDAAKKACNDANAEQPFMCLDLTFISVLLQKGFGLAENTKINLYKKINGHEISWALGVAYDLLKG